MTDPSYAALDAALERLAPFGPDLRNGLSNHAPMAVEALCALGRGDAAMGWLDRYGADLAPRPPRHARIAPADWRSALGRPERCEDWSALFAEELAEAPWREVAARWLARLAPAVCASATHGVIRVGHAVHALAEADTAPRRRELADAFASWTSAWQVLPEARGAEPAVPRRRASEALGAVARVPEAERRFRGTIVASLEDLGAFAPFAGAIDLFDASAPPEEALSDLTETFARVYLANADDLLHTIVFVHGVTGVAALRPLVPLVSPDVARSLVRYGWQSSAALYAAFGRRAPSPAAPEGPRGDADELIERAIENGDEHAIKLAAACLEENRIRPAPAYLAAAWHAVSSLPPLRKAESGRPLWSTFHASA